MKGGKITDISSMVDFAKGRVDVFIVLNDISKLRKKEGRPLVYSHTSLVNIANRSTLQTTSMEKSGKKSAWELTLGILPVIATILVAIITYYQTLQIRTLDAKIETDKLNNSLKMKALDIQIEQGKTTNNTELEKIKADNFSENQRRNLIASLELKKSEIERDLTLKGVDKDIAANSLQLKKSDVDLRMIELSLDILKTPPTEQNSELREWATNILAMNSGVAFSDDAKSSLKSSRLVLGGERLEGGISNQIYRLRALKGGNIVLLNGVKVRGIKGILTCLNPIATADQISASSQSNQFYGNLRMTSVDIENNLAVISSPEIEKDTSAGFEIANNLDGLDDMLFITSFGWGTDMLFTKSVVLTQPAVSKLKDIIPLTALTQISRLGSPKLESEVLVIEASFGKGVAGSPLYDSKNRLIGLVSGSNYYGTEISWAVLPNAILMKEAKNNLNLEVLKKQLQEINLF